MIFHHITPSKSFFLTEKNFCFKNFLSKKFFFLVLLAVFSTACSSSSGDSSSPSNTPKDQKTDSPSKKPQVSVSRCSITQFQDEASRKKPIASMKDLDVGQKLKFFYDCNIVPKDYNKKAKLEGFDNTVIQASITEIDIPAQAKTTGSFSVKGLKVGKTSIKIDLGASKELALTVIPTFVLDPNKVKIEIVTTLTALKSVIKLEVFQDKLYLLNATGSSSSDHAQFYSSSDGKNWQLSVKPQDASDNSQKIAGYRFDMTVHDGKLWAADSYDKLWSFDGTNWKKVGVAEDMELFGSLVSFENTLYQVGGYNKIFAYDDNRWQRKHTFTQAFGNIDALVFKDKIWIIGGKSDGRNLIKTVATFDGTTYQKIADLPRANEWAAVEVFPRGLLAIGGKDDSDSVTAVFYSRFGTSWKEITGITKQDELKSVFSGSTVVWNDALWVVNFSKKVLKITYDEK